MVLLGEVPKVLGEEVTQEGALSELLGEAGALSERERRRMLERANSELEKARGEVGASARRSEARRSEARTDAEGGGGGG
jgi:hypothetical protein